MSDERPRLDALLADAASGLEDVSSDPAEGGFRYARGGRAFALVVGDRVDLRLDGAIATAALRTPDVRPSDRGPGWISFRPNALDRFSVDRAIAWFEAAWRHADARRLN